VHDRLFCVILERNTANRWLPTSLGETPSLNCIDVAKHPRQNAAPVDSDLSHAELSRADLLHARRVQA